ncbi:MAG: hypothetical protein R3A10_22950 [Caldilineaceae bacterium]
MTARLPNLFATESPQQVDELDQALDYIWPEALSGRHRCAVPAEWPGVLAEHMATCRNM